MTAPASGRHDRGVSPVIGAVLMVAVVVTLAATTTALLTGFGDALHEPQGPVSFDVDYRSDGDGPGHGASINLTYTGGDALAQDQVIVRDDAGNQVRWGDVWTADGTDRVEPGDYVHIDGHGSDGELRQVCDARQRYILVFERTDGSTVVVDEYVVPTRPADRTGC